MEEEDEEAWLLDIASAGGTEAEVGEARGDPPPPPLDTEEVTDNPDRFLCTEEPLALLPEGESTDPVDPPGDDNSASS